MENKELVKAIQEVTNYFVNQLKDSNVSIRSVGVEEIKHDEVIIEVKCLLINENQYYKARYRFNNNLVECIDIIMIINYMK